MRGRAESARLLEIVDAIYAAPIDPLGWQPVMDRLSDFYGGLASLFVQDLENADATLFNYGGVDQSVIDAYFTRYAALNPWLPTLVDAPAGTLVDGGTMIPRDELVRTEFYNDWLRPAGLESGPGAILIKESVHHHQPRHHSLAQASDQRARHAPLGQLGRSHAPGN